ncbi:hypothetical protein V2A60_000759 [Cordyceps javanica]|uniref:Uncharacterized protein n=1 Tax=Cordyceps javanica TaxID=43265 RepID=A0A545V1H1_9HYPO|nr:hypothetical protein IF1G_05404 [Cordyceps javanica]TQW07224.1 hypothetical protein IF2G_05608 [Cordyceps javanica]
MVRITAAAVLAFVAISSAASSDASESGSLTARADAPADAPASTSHDLEQISLLIDTLATLSDMLKELQQDVISGRTQKDAAVA